MYFNLHIVDIDEHVNGINLFYKKKKKELLITRERNCDYNRAVLQSVLNLKLLSTV